MDVMRSRTHSRHHVDDPAGGAACDRTTKFGHRRAGRRERSAPSCGRIRGGALRATGDRWG